MSLNILLVEDDDVAAEAVIRSLRKYGVDYPIAVAQDGIEALEILRNQHAHQSITKPYLVLLDLNMPRMNGFEFIDHNKLPVPIIMVSGNNDERIVANVMRDGVFDYLPKRNLTFEDLLSSLQKGLTWARTESNISEQRARFYQLAEGLPQLVWTCSPDGRCDFVNQRWLEFTGIPDNDNEWPGQHYPAGTDKISS